MPQISINGETFDVFIVRNGEAEPIPFLMDVVPRTVTATTRVNSAATSTLLVAQNLSRKGISIYNNSTAALFLSYANPATSGNAFMQMAPGSLLMLDQQLIVTNAIYGIWTAANGAAQITQYS